MRPIFVLSGPNLGRLGTREPEVYGRASYPHLVAAVDALAGELGVAVDCRQTDTEGQMIGWLHEAADTAAAVVLNPGAWTHYAYAVRDAVALVTGAGVPVIEVHLSQPAAREEFRHVSVVAGVATGTVSGLGVQSYLAAVRALAERTIRPA